MSKPGITTAAEIQARIESGEDLQIIDVRENEEVATHGIIPGAKHIRAADIEHRHTELDPQAETVVVCRSGRRSKAVCNFLQKQGYGNLKNMVDGMLAWRGEVEDYYP
ncbi:rhodanese-like domain-containing protein [Tumebacillus permanentifrigoris]|uniref:Rhodanese-related sulfurtransferase n=1 Tax=Tumebacillus permanentifrigoris TaxID=378543 RepID=A0A316D7I3_9BACL|nr:rhodanese-like domain-containing protein [Tumebacillus permanentifrigoris]PWK09038.1 rhodanese-related sulfurtransferase [Tumebacillus permanentifrigoris]